MRSRKIFACQNCGGEMVFKKYRGVKRLEWAHILWPPDFDCYVGIYAWNGEDGRLPVETVVKRLI